MILNIRVDHHTADIAQIERATRKLEDIFERCQNDDDIEEHLYIKTCNRSEIYLVSGKPQEDLLSGGDFIIDQDEEALRHLYAWHPALNP